MKSFSSSSRSENLKFSSSPRGQCRQRTSRVSPDPRPARSSRGVWFAQLNWGLYCTARRRLGRDASRVSPDPACAPKPRGNSGDDRHLKVQTATALPAASPAPGPGSGDGHSPRTIARRLGSSAAARTWKPGRSLEELMTADGRQRGATAAKPRILPTADWDRACWPGLGPQICIRSLPNARRRAHSPVRRCWRARSPAALRAS